MPYKNKEDKKTALRKYYLNNKKKILKNRKKTGSILRSKIKAMYDEYKSTLKCSKCNENDPCCLDFHHIDPNNKKNNVSCLLNRYSWNTILQEIQKCIVLCKNCHFKHHNP
jgi:hypothetical protein